ncbi:dead end protein 1-like isoform X1 [Myripristis murdjan]|uniref:dead end protein 1-like isoform X1 n=1 Tax=Myripristis murdjan TaxID=586833 RepID=UPI0011761704|nr:dead end protein 1-like isoform X1 [Myripristis murdjan]
MQGKAESKTSQAGLLNLERLKALDTWLNQNNVKLTQVNGQRKYGGPPEVWDGPPPGDRCEVFISPIPRDAYEDLLIPLFSSVAPLWEFRLMMNFSGQNRGFAYAKYGTPALAGNAIRLLNGYMLEPGARLSVCRSTEKHHLCIGELPFTTRQEDLMQALHGLTEGVEGVSLKSGPGIVGMSAVVAFSSHHAASMAKKMLVEAFKKNFALTVSIKWQSSVKPSKEGQASSQKHPKSILPCPTQPPRRHSNTPQPRVLPPRLVRSPSIPPGFCKAVGGPTTTQPPHAPCLSSSAQGPQVAMEPMALLLNLCEVFGGGQPLCELHYSHAGPEGYLYFGYTVNVPKLATPFTGLVTVLPGPCMMTMMEEARRAMAQQVLQALQKS